MAKKLKMTVLTTTSGNTVEVMLNGWLVEKATTWEDVELLKSILETSNRFEYEERYLDEKPPETFEDFYRRSMECC